MPAEEAIQLAVDQPTDIEVHLDGSIVDSFEFGKETVTLLNAKSLMITIQPAAADAAESAWNVSMSWRRVSLQEASSWREAEVYASRSKQTGRIEDITKSFELWRATGDRSAIARTYLKQGDALLAIADSLSARAVYEDALRECQDTHDLRCAAEAANNSGYASFLLGQLDASSRRLREAVAAWHRLSMPLLEGRTLNNLGMMFRQSGDFDRAIEALGTALRILRNRDMTVYAQALNNLGLCYQSLSEHEKAIAHFQSALGLLTARRQRTSRLRINLARSYLLLGRAQLSANMLEVALAESTTAANPVRGDILNHLGQALLKIGRLGDARARLSDALTLQRESHSRRGEAIALHYLGVEAVERGDAADARTLFTEAILIRRGIGVRDELSESVFALAELEYRAGHLSVARQLVEEAIALAELLRVKVSSPNLRATFYGRKRRFFDLMLDIEAAEAAKHAAIDPAAGFLASEQSRSRSILDLALAGGISGVVPRNLEVRRTRIRHEVDLLSSRIAELDSNPVGKDRRTGVERTREELRRRIALLSSEQEQVEMEVQRSASAFVAFSRSLASIVDVQSALPPDTALLEYYVGERQSYLWVIQPESLSSFRLPSRAVIEELSKRTASRFSALDDRRRSSRLQAAFAADLQRLSNILLGPVKFTRPPARLVFVLDGVLNYVPIAALRPSWTREPIGLAFDLVQAPSAAYLLAGRAPRRVSEFSGSFLAVADPVFSLDDPRVSGPHMSPAPRSILARLPFSTEIAMVRSLVPLSHIKTLQGFDASIPALMKAGLSNFAVLHFSTHTVIDDRLPELSRVVLSLIDRDGRMIAGYLRASHFSDMRLNGSVVVLASCETALGKEVPGEGLLGFANALFSAGSSQLVLTVAKVDAESSSALFSEAYRRFFGSHGGRMERAIRLGRRALASSERWSDPYYWAAYTVVGNLSRGQ